MKCLPALSLSALVLLFTGCASSPNQSRAIQNVTAQGRVFGGEQPVSGAAIQLYAVNATTNGGASTALIAATVTTSDGSGNTSNTNANAGNNYNRFPAGFFTITGDYTCPSADTLVYLAYNGGNPGAGVNTAQRGLVALGACGNLSASTDITLNELTTVGTVAALHNFMSAYNAVGSTAANSSALTAAFSTAAEYYSSSTGTAPGPALPAGYDASSNDLRALANVVQSCVNSDGNLTTGHPCATFFADARGSASTAPTDTVTALLDIAADPTNNVAALFALQSSTPSFEPTNASAPVDWSLPILSPPAISPNGGTFTAATSVTLSDTDPTATLYYTTNGNTPTSSSTKYTGAFSLSSTATVKAIAIEPNGLNSPVSTASFIINIPVAVAPTVSLSAATTAQGATAGLTVLASSNANGSTVTFGTVNSIGGSFNPTTCVIASGACITLYTPSGSLSAATYANDLTASFGAATGYTAATAQSTLTVKAATNPPTPATLFAFTGVDGAGSYTGRHPMYATLIQANDGLIYGTAQLGGNTTTSSFGSGVVFSLNPSTLAYNVIHEFSGENGNDGANPYPGVIQSPFDGLLYGTTFEGGNGSNYGVIYSVPRVPGSSDNIVHTFSGTNPDGTEPYSSPIPASDGNLYGAVYGGGANSSGYLYKVDKNGNYSLITSFTSATNGAFPRGALVQHPSDGFLYGTASMGGSASGGTLFKFDPTSSSPTITVLHTFYSSTTDGKTPTTALTVGPNGYLYGTTTAGGTNAGGTIFRIDSQGNNYSVLYNFAASSTDAKSPQSALYLATDGFLYGVTSAGGASAKGAIYRIDPDGTNYSSVYSFGALPDGEVPYGALMQASDGNFYGTASAGGNSTNSFGTVFRMASGPAPIQLVVPPSVVHGGAFTLAYSVSNAYSTTLQTCYASNNAGDTTGWAGLKAGSPTAKTIALTAPSAGTYTYGLTCGGVESGFATLTVQ